MQMAVYAGFPAALNGLFAAKDVFARRFPPAGGSPAPGLEAALSARSPASASRPPGAR